MHKLWKSRDIFLSFSPLKITFFVQFLFQCKATVACKSRILQSRANLPDQFLLISHLCRKVGLFKLAVINFHALGSLAWSAFRIAKVIASLYRKYNSPMIGRWMREAPLWDAYWHWLCEIELRWSSLYLCLRKYFRLFGFYVLDCPNVLIILRCSQLMSRHRYIYQVWNSTLLMTGN